MEQSAGVLILITNLVLLLLVVGGFILWGWALATGPGPRSDDDYQDWP